MRAILLNGYNKGITFQTIKPLKLNSLDFQKILVKVKYASINPSDLGYIGGVYGRFQRTDFPHSIGFEGSGIIEDATVDFRDLKGKKVAFFTNYENEK